MLLDDLEEFGVESFDECEIVVVLVESVNDPVMQTDQLRVAGVD